MKCRLTACTTPNILRSERNVACQNVRKTGRVKVQLVTRKQEETVDLPTALTEKSFNKGLCGASSCETVI